MNEISKVEDPAPVDVSRNIPAKSSNWKTGFFVLLIILIALLAGGTYFYLNYSKSPKLSGQAVMQAQPSVSPQITNTPTASDKWAVTPKNFMGSYTFQYPAGWHVVNQWPANYTDGITIYLNPDPVNFAPRGGPISALRMTDTSGKQNPDELFISERNKFKANLTDGKEETITSDIGPIYHYWGKINLYNDLVDTEGYFFQLQGGVNDLINKHNIFATTDTNGKYSDILKEVVLSFKKPQ